MCGIVGMFENEELAFRLVEGLKHLEYRGYDSAGVTVIQNSMLKTIKVRGRVRELAENRVGISQSHLRVLVPAGEGD